MCLSVVSHTTGGLSSRCLNTTATIFSVYQNYINFCTKIIAFVGAACKSMAAECSKRFSVVVAVALNNGIGYENRIPWPRIRYV